MTTQIAKSMMSPDIGGLEAGDLSWSARSSKVGWLPFLVANLFIFARV